MSPEPSPHHLQLTSLVFGAGVFSGAYDAFDEDGPVNACRLALEHGLNLFDTSPYYGRSEEILGAALLSLRDRYSRNTYYISTKVGRYGYYVKDFDYSAARTRASVEESMRRLGTDYIDIVFCHDVEFQSIEEVVGSGRALEELFRMKDEGKIHHVGISGYPLPVLLKIAQHQHSVSRSLDIILSYCQYNLQNTLLATYSPHFRAAGVKYILNASPLSMGLLRDETLPVPAWHPAPPAMRQAAKKASRVARELGYTLDELATLYALQGNDLYGFTATVIGFERPDKVQLAVQRWRSMATLTDQERNRMEGAFKRVVTCFEEVGVKDFVWESPTEKEREGISKPN